MAADRTESSSLAFAAALAHRSVPTPRLYSGRGGRAMASGARLADIIAVLSANSSRMHWPEPVHLRLSTDRAVLSIFRYAVLEGRHMGDRFEAVGKTREQ